MFNARACLASTSAYDNLEKHAAVVLERIARGGGSVDWYYCRSPKDLDALTFRAGSVVSLYFDERLKVRQNSPNAVEGIKQVIDVSGECVVGALQKDLLVFEVDYLTSIDELAEIQTSFSDSTWVLFGPFPARDNDGEKAITITVPDEDGVVRQHPH